MKRDTNELYYQLVTLLLAFIVIHTIFVTLVRPNADIIIRQQVERASVDGNYVVPRSIFVVIKDLEQESCFILMVWAFAIMGFKTRSVYKEQALLKSALINVREGSRILIEDVDQFTKPLESLEEEQRNLLLPRALQSALMRFQMTGNIQSANDAVAAVCDTESERLDSELSMIRYIAWAIPSIGFIGTVRGIGAALGQAHEAMQGNIAGVTSSLGVAFNSTFVALLISMVVMFFMHQLQLIQERLVHDSQRHCETQLLRFLKV